MSRYDLPDPKCNHATRAGRVQAGTFDGDGPHASVWVCSREACIADAKEWAEAQTRLPARFIPRAVSSTSTPS